MKLFYSFGEWKKYIISAIRNVFVGLLRILWSIIIGVVSVIAYILRAVSSFSKREPRAMLVIVIMLTVIGFLWMMNFVNERSMRVKAELQRDSISLKLDSAKQNAYRHNPFGVNHLDGDEQD